MINNPNLNKSPIHKLKFVKIISTLMEINTEFWHKDLTQQSGLGRFNPPATSMLGPNCPIITCVLAFPKVPMGLQYRRHASLWESVHGRALSSVVLGLGHRIDKFLSG